MNPPRFEAQSRIDTPLGALTLAATAKGLALAWFDAQAHRSAEVDAPQRPDHPHLTTAAREFAEYFAGTRREFTVPLDPQGTLFQQHVWRELLHIPMGALSTYGTVAARLGRPEAARAVGAAVGRNPVAIIVPCHRVVGRDGSLTGYAAGLPRKEALLRLEGALLV
jgi:methylated-DNA-[protein]-cysteine S-methyltransferase